MCAHRRYRRPDSIRRKGQTVTRIRFGANGRGAEAECDSGLMGGELLGEPFAGGHADFASKDTREDSG